MIITSTPLRVSFLGGNTDFPEYYLNYGGLVLTTTIDKYIYCIVKERKFDNKIIVNYSVKEEVERVEDLKHELVREALKLVGIKGGIEISFLADIPTQGTGLGSSSAVTVGVLNALHTFKGENIGAEELAWQAVKIEIDILKKPIGIQDQHAVSVGGLRKISINPVDSVLCQKIMMDESIKEDFNNSLMLLYTGVTRKTESVLSTFSVEKNVKLLHQNKELARMGVDNLLRGQLKQFGKNLDFYWDLKKTMNGKVTNGEIDKMYEKAKKAGAYGGKVIGAGGGGFLLIMFPASRRAKIREALKEYKELPFRLADDGSKVILNI